MNPNTKMNLDPYPCITVATVTYNAEKTLGRTLKSVATQTYPNIEHLIIDGCSKDGTLEMVHQYVEENTAARVPHLIHLIKEPDKGLYDAMNKALLNAEGDYICFLNAGDTFHHPDTLKRIVENINWNKDKKQNPAIIYGETDIVDEKGNFIRHRRLQSPEHLNWRSFLEGMLVCHQSFYVRTDLGRQELYNMNYRFSADFDWCIRLMKRAQTNHLELHNTHEILTDYLNEGMTTKNHKKSLWERLHIMARHYGWYATIKQHLWFVLRALIKR